MMYREDEKKKIGNVIMTIDEMHTCISELLELHGNSFYFFTTKKQVMLVSNHWLTKKQNLKDEQCRENQVAKRDN